MVGREIERVCARTRPRLFQVWRQRTRGDDSATFQHLRQTRLCRPTIPRLSPRVLSDPVTRRTVLGCCSDPSLSRSFRRVLHRKNSRAMSVGCPPQKIIPSSTFSMDAITGPRILSRLFDARAVSAHNVLQINRDVVVNMLEYMLGIHRWISFLVNQIVKPIFGLPSKIGLAVGSDTRPILRRPPIWERKISTIDVSSSTCSSSS